jgi:hypothetical protein
VERYEAGSAFQLGGFSPIRFLLFLFWPVLQFNLLALSTSAVRTRAISLVLGLSFYPLEQASKHGDLCNEQIRDSNERSNLSCGFCSPKRLLQTRAVAAKKFICGLAGVISVAPLLFLKR